MCMQDAELEAEGRPGINIGRHKLASAMALPDEEQLGPVIPYFQQSSGHNATAFNLGSWRKPVQLRLVSGFLRQIHLERPEVKVQHLAIPAQAGGSGLPAVVAICCDMQLDMLSTHDPNCKDSQDSRCEGYRDGAASGHPSPELRQWPFPSCPC